jgi:phospholipase D1/2
LRTALVAEHLDVAPQTVARAIVAANGSLISALEALRSGGRSLVPFEPPEFGVVADTMLRENDILDPECPARRWPWS